MVVGSPPIILERKHDAETISDRQNTSSMVVAASRLLTELDETRESARGSARRERDNADTDSEI